VRTLARRRRFLADLVIADDARLGAKVIRKWMALEPELRFIALTATPWRKDMAEEYQDAPRGLHNKQEAVAIRPLASLLFGLQRPNRGSDQLHR
jgi:hypothetical protein